MAHITRKMEVLRHFPLPATIVLLAIGIALGIALLGFVSAAMRSRTVPIASSAPAPAPSVLQAEQPFDTAQGKPEPQNTESPNVVAPAPVAWPLVQVAWTPVTDLSILPPAEQGFYNGTMQNAPDGATATHELGVYAAKIVSGRYGFTDNDLYSAVAAISRDPSNSQIILAGLELIHMQVVPSVAPWPIPIPSGRLFLSTDGEKTWHEINLFPPVLEGGMLLPWETRVATQSNGSILLFVRGGGGGDGNWRQTTLAP